MLERRRCLRDFVTHDDGHKPSQKDWKSETSMEDSKHLVKNTSLLRESPALALSHMVSKRTTLQRCLLVVLRLPHGEVRSCGQQNNSEDNFVSVSH
jgi:hypothetical protein